MKNLPKMIIFLFGEKKDEVINNLSRLALYAGVVLYFKHKLNDFKQIS